MSKNRKRSHRKIPHLQRIAKSIRANSAVLYGEIVALDKSGVPCIDGTRSRNCLDDCVISLLRFQLTEPGWSGSHSNPLTQKAALDIKRSFARRQKGKPQRPNEVVIRDRRLPSLALATNYNLKIISLSCESSATYSMLLPSWCHL